MVRILVFGTGCVGTLYALLLHNGGAKITCICRSNFSAVRSEGLTVHSTIFGTQKFRPHVVSSVEAATQSNDADFDYILVCTKAFPKATPSPATLIQGAVRPGYTRIVLIQNGIGIEHPYSTQFPGNIIISGVTYSPTAQGLGGTVVHTEVQALHLGAFAPHGTTQAGDIAVAEEFGSLVRLGGGHAQVHSDVQVERWKKMVGNASWNPVCTLSGCRDLQFLAASDLAHTFIMQTMQEVVAVAAAEGYGDYVRQDAAEMQLARSAARTWPGVEPSMMADAAKGAEIEVDAIIGELVRLGRAKGVTIPRLETLFVLLAGFAARAKK